MQYHYYNPSKTPNWVVIDADYFLQNVSEWITALATKRSAGEEADEKDWQNFLEGYKREKAKPWYKRDWLFGSQEKLAYHESDRRRHKWAYERKWDEIWADFDTLHSTARRGVPVIVSLDFWRVLTLPDHTFSAGCRRDYAYWSDPLE